MDTFPLVIAELDGTELVVDKRPPNGPEGLTVSVVSPKRGHLTDHSILVFHQTFDPEEDLNKTQVERNELRVELKETTERERALRKEVGQLRARVKELETDLARDRAEVRGELAQVQIKGLEVLAEKAPKEN